MMPQSTPIARADCIVLGAGIIGLTTARTLQQRGYRVHIIARDLPMQTTSAVSAALWFPYRAEPRTAVLRWGKIARTIFETEMRAHPDHGVMMTRFIELFDVATSNVWWRDMVEHVRPLMPEELAEFPSAQSGFTTDVPVIQTNVYLPMLWQAFQEHSGTWEQRALASPEDILDAMHPQTVLVNCTGLGAKHLLNDQAMYAIRGDVVVVENSGIRRSVVNDSHPNYPRYTIAREHDVVIGGTALEETHSASEADDRAFALPNATYYHQVLNALPTIEPQLSTPIISAYRVGLRPGRTAIRLEQEILFGKKVIHNYGHGGSGVTLSWGCAHDVAAMVQQCL
jgi:D-amino-acid oxidase